MFVLVRFLFVFVVRMFMPVLLVVLSLFVLMAMGVLMRMTVLDVSVTMLVVMLMSVLMLVFHNTSAPKYSSLE
jgi:hypothetical protein